MSELLTPKQVARAIQVSEASIKRWCDKGLIPTQYTAGGHRRIPLRGLLDFLRSTGHALVHPELLGLSVATGQTDRAIHRAAGQLTDALLTGDEERCRRIALDLYLAGHSVSAICDQVFAKAFEAIGDAWQCGDAEIYQERRGCEITRRLLHELRAVAPPPAQAPLALGGAVEGDPYNLAATMVELVLRSAGWNAVSLGDNLPFATLAAALEQHRPRMFWLSCSHLTDEAAFVEGYGRLYDEFGLATAFVVGGRALTEEVRCRIKYAAYCDTMGHLEAFAQTLQTAAQRRNGA